MIYPNKEAAQEALIKIEKELSALLKERGAWLYSGSEYHWVEISVTYLNEKGCELPYSKNLDLE